MKVSDSSLYSDRACERANYQNSNGDILSYDVHELRSKRPSVRRTQCPNTAPLVQYSSSRHAIATPNHAKDSTSKSNSKTQRQHASECVRNKMNRVNQKRQKLKCDNRNNKQKQQAKQNRQTDRHQIKLITLPAPTLVSPPWDKTIKVNGKLVTPCSAGFQPKIASHNLLT